MSKIQSWREYYMEFFSPVFEQEDIEPDKRNGLKLRKFVSPKDMAQSCIEYLVLCRETNRPITLTGMAVACGYYNRAAFAHADMIPGFETCIQIAKISVEIWVEEQLYGRNTHFGAKFVLQAGFKTWIPEEKRTVENRSFEVTIGPGKDES
jgi:hypothetical protein